LASNVATDRGCGFEHVLQAFEFALVAKGIGNDDQQTSFLRPDATLALLFITDEDDCSAATNDGIFDLQGELTGESASLRCATRAHACGGVNLTTVPGCPTTAAFQAPFASCVARTDDCPNALDGASSTDTSVPTTCSPLRSVKRMAAGLKSLKASPAQQIVVAGIFGWPRSQADVSTAVYRIDQTPKPNGDTAHPTYFDLWPICFDSAHPPVGDSYDARAFGWAAAPGLRLAAFVDEFGANGLKASVCEADFSDAMRAIGATLASRLNTQNALVAPSR
jgi:hypothetical protein